MYFVFISTASTAAASGAAATIFTLLLAQH